MKFWMMVEKEAGFFFPSLTEECINTISILGLGSQGPGSSGGLAECKGLCTHTYAHTHPYLSLC